MKFFLAFAALIAVAAANPLYTWSLEELTEAVNNPNTNPALRPYLEFALNELKNTIANGLPVDAIVVPTPGDVEAYSYPSAWTLQQLSEALQHPHTSPAMVPLLEAALDELMTALYAGQNVNSIVINLPVDNVVVEPLPVFPVPDPAPIPDLPPITLPALPADSEESLVDAPSAPVSSPLVQVIVNVNGQQQMSHEIVPTPVNVVDDIDPETQALLRH